MAEKTHQQRFVDEAIADLFHSSPEMFIGYLNRDGNRFLRFYWEKVGGNLPAGERNTPYGMDFAIRQPYGQCVVCLITLPAPRADGEAHYVALAFRPWRRLLLGLVQDTTKLLALERTRDEQGCPGTRLVEISRRLEREIVSRDVPEKLEEFYTAVVRLLKAEE